MKNIKNKQNSLLDKQLCFAIYEVNRLFNKFYQQSLEEFNLTYPQYIVLLVLWEKDEQQLKDLTEILSLKSNTLTPLLKRMEDNGWVIREKPISDKRQLIVKLTEKAKKNKDKILKTVESCAKIEEIEEKDITKLKNLKEDVLKLKEKLKTLVIEEF